MLGRKILMYGSNGWIGENFITHVMSINKEIEIIPSEYRINVQCVSELKSEIEKHMPTNLFCCVGTTRNNHCETSETSDITTTTIDYLEDNLDINLENNYLALLILVELGRRYQIHTTIIGTGCVYDDTEALEIKDDFDPRVLKNYRQFTEYDLPNYNGSAYSCVKASLNNYITSLFETSIIPPKLLYLRIRMPILNGKDKFDFISKLIRYKRVINVYNSMTFLPDFYDNVIKMMDADEIGIFNMVNDDFISQVDILELYKKYVNPLFSYEIITVDELHSITKGKRSNNVLSTSKLERFGYQIPSILQRIEEMFRDNFYG